MPNLSQLTLPVKDTITGQVTQQTFNISGSGGGGDSTNFVGTLAQWEALTQAEKNQYDSVDLTDDYTDIMDEIEDMESTYTEITGQFDDLSQAITNKVDTEDLANVTKITRIEISTVDWVEDTTSQVGETLYKKTIALNNVYVESPSVSIGAVGRLPSTDEQEAFDLLQYVTVDSEVPCLYLYASEAPTTMFYINVEGAD